MITKKSVVLMLMFLLTACGYHLRGAIELPEALQKIYVRGASAELSNAIAATFRSASGELVATVAEAGMILNVINEDYQRRTISIDSSGYSNEHDLVYRLTFDLLDNQGAVLISAQTIEVSKSYFNTQSSDTVLSKGNEEAVLRKELYSQAVRSVIDRARAELKKTLP
ncbi:MAG: LPS assembly lipoprotein LptE [Methyloprofundus sp.]|nr:LPS assembly lipoprotein LptE [Methyloprofundus sp.]MDT8426006.1 LPS assembly lipoprotein LptE [Methyloprofundus sp.]